MGEAYPEFFEGGDEAVFSDHKTLWIGTSSKSHVRVHENISMMGYFGTVICELTMSTFSRPSTCFALVDEKTALWYPPAFAPASRAQILRRLPGSIVVTREEADALVCNAMTLGKTVISPIGISMKTRKQLEGRGFKVLELDLSEFLKAGGGCQSLVLRLF